MTKQCYSETPHNTEYTQYTYTLHPITPHPPILHWSFICQSDTTFTAIAKLVVPQTRETQSKYRVSLEYHHAI